MPASNIETEGSWAHISPIKPKYEFLQPSDIGNCIAYLKYLARNAGQQNDGFALQQIIETGSKLVELGKITKHLPAAHSEFKNYVAYPVPPISRIIDSLEIALQRPDKTGATQEFFGKTPEKILGRYRKQIKPIVKSLELDPASATALQVIHRCKRLIKEGKELPEGAEAVLRGLASSFSVAQSGIPARRSN